MTITENITFMGYNELNDFSVGIIAFCWDEFEIKYYHPWNQTVLATETDNTSMINDRLRLKNIPTLTESIPFVLFTVHRAGTCAEGFFGLHEQEFALVDSTSERIDESFSSLTIENEKLTGCTVIPNPTRGAVYIHSVDPVVSLTLFNCQGELIHQLNDPAGQYQMENYSQGLYHLRIQTNQEVFFFKILKL